VNYLTSVTDTSFVLIPIFFGWNGV